MRRRKESLADDLDSGYEGPDLLDENNLDLAGWTETRRPWARSQGRQAGNWAPSAHYVFLFSLEGPTHRLDD